MESDSSIHHHVDRRVAMMAGHFRPDIIGRNSGNGISMPQRNSEETVAGSSGGDVVYPPPESELARHPTAAQSAPNARGGFTVAAWAVLFPPYSHHESLNLPNSRTVSKPLTTQS